MSNLDVVRREYAKRELARKSFKRYLYYVHGPAWKRTKMSDYLADTVQEFAETDTGNAYDILIIETPPQHGKSQTITESFPAWYLGRHPQHRIIEASYNAETAERFGRKSMDKVERFGRTLFGVEYPGGVWTKTEFELSNGLGRMISRGIMSGITGNPANLMIIDDPIKNREEADSPTYRRKLWDEWQNSLKSRLAAGAKIILIMTPWHEDDLAARILATEENVRLVRLPVEAEENDPLGRAVGEPLAPELGKGERWLKQFKASYLNDPSTGGRRTWTALYQCSPRVEGGNLVHRDWWQTYRPSDYNGFPLTVISVDATFKGGETSDFVAIEVWSKMDASYYLRYGINRQMDFPETVKAIRSVRQLFPEAQYTLIEDKANGSAIISTLRKEFAGIVAINPEGGKESRVNACSPAIESGNVFVPENSDFAKEMIDQFSTFPAGQHDDMVDAASQALNWMLFSNGRVPQRETAKQTAERIRAEMEQDQYLSDEIYDPYG